MLDRIARRTLLKKGGLLTGGAMMLLLKSRLALADDNIPLNGHPVDCKITDLRNGRQIRHRIIVTGDGHWFDQHITTTHPRLGKWANNIPYQVRHEQMITWLNHEKDTTGVDFVVFNGDLVTNHPEHLPVVKEQYDRVKAKYYVVHGNHDHSSDENWKKLWGYGRNHSFEFEDYAVILLNSADEKGTYECADHAWLKAALEKYRNKTGILIFCHIYQHGNGSDMGVDCKEITDLMLNTENLKLVAYSHKHRINGHYPVFKSLDDGGRQLDVFFTGHFCAWGLPYLGYRVIEIYEDGEMGTYAFDPLKGVTLNWTRING